MTVKAMRINANLRQEDVAKELKITTQSYRNKELGKTEFKLNEAIKLCELFKVSLEDFR